MHPDHQQVRDTFVAFMLEVMLGEPQSVVTETVHAGRHRLGFAEHRHEVLIGMASLVGGGLILTHVAEVDVSGIKR